MAYKVRFEDLGMIRYKEAWEYQEKELEAVVAARACGGRGTLIFCEHPHVFTLGKSGDISNLLIDRAFMQGNNIEYFHTDRGGDITYHGPGQIVGYPILDLEACGIGIKDYVARIEESIILTLKEFGIAAARLKGATGVWLEPETAGTRKICAIGIKASRYVTMHGFAFNINTNLDYFKYINPCGFTDKSVTSLSRELGEPVDFEAVKGVLKNKLAECLGLELS